MKSKIVCTLICMFISSSIWAATNPVTENSSSMIDSMAYDMNEIVVTATRTPLMLKETPVITRVISGRDLEQRGITTLQSALEGELAGVEFHQAGYGSSMSFQGLDARYILFLVDGERMAGETYGNIDYSRISMNNIERIEIVRGASSVLYGSNAMGAVVNVITKTPKDKVEILTSVRYGTPYQKNDQRIGGLKYNSKLDIPNLNGDILFGFNFGKLRSQTNISYLGVDAYSLKSTKGEERHYDSLKITSIKMAGGRPVPSVRYALDTTLTAPIDTLGLSVSGWKSVNVTQSFDYELSSKVRLFVTGNYFDKSRYDFPTSINTGGDATIWTNESYWGLNIKGGIEYRPNDRNILTLTYHGDIYKRNLDSLNYVIPKQRHTYNIPRLLWTSQVGNYNRITSGLEYVGEKLNFDLNPDGYNERKSMNTISAYAQDEISTNLPVSFVAGVRIDHNNMFGWSVTPKASVKYTYKKLSLRGNYSQGYRSPSIKELYMDYLIPTQGMAGKMYIVGNPNLKAEYNQYFSISAEYTSGFTNISLTGFKSYFRDKIDVRREIADRGTNMIYENIDKSEFSGLEFMARTRIVKGLFVMANYNYISQTEDAPAASTQYIFISPHTATLQLDYHLGIKNNTYGINFTGRYIGPKTYEEFMPIIKMPKKGPQIPTIYSGTYSAKHQGYVVCNATVSAEFNNALGISVGVDNIFDYKSEVINFNSAINPGRNAFVRLTYSFSAN